MPQITLDLVSLDSKPLVGLSRRFEGAGGTIGRDAGNTLALPDSHRRVSRLHASITFPDGVPTITNSSAVLPIGVGGMELKCGQALPLLPGMNLDIGPYVLTVRRGEAVEEPAPAPVAAAMPAPAARPAAAAMPAAAVVPTAPFASPPISPPPAQFSPGASDDPLLALAQSAAAVAPVAPLAAAPSSIPGDPFAELLSGLPAAPANLAPASAPIPVAPHAPLNPAPLGVVDDPLAGLGVGAAAPHPAGGIPGGGEPDYLAMLGVGGGPGASGQQAAPIADSRPLHAPPPAAVVIPEDFNPFELPSAQARNSADPLAAMLGGAAAPSVQALTQDEHSIDKLFAPAGASIGDVLIGGSPGADILGGGGPAALLGQPDNADPLALFGGSSPGSEGQMKPMRDDLAEIGGAYQPPRAVDPVFSFTPAPPPVHPAAIQANPLQPAPRQAVPDSALTQAFLAGAGLQPSALPDGLTPEIMTMVGSLLRSATAGAIEMLAIRANIKREVQASVTIISTEANNPLKFLPDADSVLHQMLGKKIPGFLRPDEAMKDAFNDLRAHEMGVIAGTRAALDEALKKFDPALLGDRLVKGSLLEMAVPAMRKTKLWDLYLERYAELRREVEDDFQSVFGKAFVAAYEAEAARMKALNLAKGS